MAQVIIDNRGNHVVTFPAGGYINLEDDYYNEPYYKLEVFNGDGSPYNHKFMDSDAVRELETRGSQNDFTLDNIELHYLIATKSVQLNLTSYP